MYQSSSQPQCDPLGAFTGVRALLDLEPQGTKLSSPEDCLNYLSDTATLRFGYAARDVLSAVFMPDATTLLHEQAFHITYEHLKTAVSSLAINRTADSKDHRTYRSPIWPFRGGSLESPFQVRLGGKVHSQETGRYRTYRPLPTNQLFLAHSASRDNGWMVP
jgi:hypothetical protein